MSDLNYLSDAQILARTIWGEARGEPDIGKQAIACVVNNRVKLKGWWGSDIRDVCLKPFQFSCWNKNDPNRAKLMAVSAVDPAFAKCLDIAAQAIAGTLPDVTSGADSYEARGIDAFWAKNLTPVASIGKHDFYITK